MFPPPGLHRKIEAAVVLERPNADDEQQNRTCECPPWIHPVTGTLPLDDEYLPLLANERSGKSAVSTNRNTTRAAHAVYTKCSPPASSCRLRCPAIQTDRDGP